MRYRYQTKQVGYTQRDRSAVVTVRIFTTEWEAERRLIRHRGVTWLIILETAVQDDKVMQDFELEFLSREIDIP